MTTFSIRARARASHPRRLAALLLPLLGACTSRTFIAPEPHPIEVGTGVFQQTLNRKLDIYTDHLFRQARWEIDRLRIELAADQVTPLVERAARAAEQAAQTSANFDRLVPDVERALSGKSDGPKPDEEAENPAGAAGSLAQLGIGTGVRTGRGLATLPKSRRGGSLAIRASS